MGRRKRFKKKKAEAFNPMEKDLLESYLSYYSHAASIACSPDASSSSRNGRDEDEEEETIQMSNTQSAVFENDSTNIAGHEFPKLTKEALKRPYLSLPSTLESKHRRTVFDLCIHVGLYQTSIGDKFNDDRRKIVSIFPDGFEYIENDVPHDPPPSFPVMECRPWYFRNDIGGECPSPTSRLPSGHLTCSDDNGGTNASSSHRTNTDRPQQKSDSDRIQAFSFGPQFMSRRKVRETTKEYQQKIQTLADYPRTCLREHADVFDEFLKVTPLPFIVDTIDTFVVDTGEKMKKVANDMIQNKNISEIAFDLEAYNASKYKQATCLIQLCTNTKDEYVIDVLAPGVWDTVSLLAPIFANPAIVKVGHGIASIDIPCLHRDFGIFVVNAFDTMESAKILGLKGHLGLAKLCKYYELQSNDGSNKYEELKGLYQNTDWRLRPLKKEMIEYGILDVRFLISLRKLLIRDMIKAVGDDNMGNYASQSSDLGSNVLKNMNSLDMKSDNHSLHDEPINEIVALSNSIMESTILEECEEGEDSNEDDEEQGGYATADSFDLYNIHEDEGYVDAKNDEDDQKDDPFEKLKYNEILMHAIQKSQYQCLSLWSDKSEDCEKNDTLVGLLRRAERLREDFNDDGNKTKYNNISTIITNPASVMTQNRKKKKTWDRHDMVLYKDLFEWRNDVAKKIGIMPAMMCSLDLLVLIAYARPTCILGLKKLNYFLPEFFRDEVNVDYLEDLFLIVQAATKDNNSKVETHKKNNDTTRFYADCNQNGYKKHNSFQGREIEESKEIGYDNNDHNQNDTISISKSYRTLQITTIIAGIAAFWIGVAARRRK